MNKKSGKTLIPSKRFAMQMESIPMSSPEIVIDEAIVVFLKKRNLRSKDVKYGIEKPVDEKYGDWTTNLALVLASRLKKSPMNIAEEFVKEASSLLSENRKIDGEKEEQAIFSKVEIVKPGFINFHISEAELLNRLNEVLIQGNKYGRSDYGEEKTWLIEHTSPNPNKAMHLGHLRNNVTGMALANLAEFIGYKVIRDCIDNDRGIAMAKLMWGYLQFARKEEKEQDNLKFEQETLQEQISYWFKHQDEWLTPEDIQKRPDRFVDELYVKGATDFKEDPDVEKKVRQMVIDWEAEDERTWALWKKVLEYSHIGQKLTLDRLGSFWDKVWHEHDHYKKGKDLVRDGLKKGVFRKSEGAVVTDLVDYGIPDTVVVKDDGTALYITQDLALTKLKKETFHADRMFWVVGSDQILALQQVFAVCEQLGFGRLEEYTHIPYGRMSIKGQGKMSSRAGNVVYIDELLDTARNKVQKVMKESINSEADDINDEVNGVKNVISLTNKNRNEKKISDVAEIIALGAVKYSLLKVGRMRNIMFDFDESLSFEGNSGPYLQYAYARCRSILRKAVRMGIDTSQDIFIGKYSPNFFEIDLLRRIYSFSETILKSGLLFAPNVLADYLYNLASSFNGFYKECSILKGSNMDNSEHHVQEIKFRLVLTKAVSITLQNGLRLLGIDTVERM